MNLNTIKLDKIFHDLLNIISDLQTIDKNCKKRECKYSKETIHDLLIKCEKRTLKLRQDLLEAIEED